MSKYCSKVDRAPGVIFTGRLFVLSTDLFLSLLISEIKRNAGNAVNHRLLYRSAKPASLIPYP